MKKTKKLLAIVLSLLMIFAFMIGCSNNEEEQAIHSEPLNERPYAHEDPLPIEDEEPTVHMISTPDSSCFSEIGYDEWEATLYVRFRDSGSLYCYYDFYDWDSFYDADSLGSYYNSEIKGYYECHRLE